MSNPQTIPQSVGRPLERSDKPLEIPSFSAGTDAFYPTTSVATGYISRIINGRCTQGTTLNRRNGFAPFGTEGDAGSVYMSASLQVFDGNDIQLRLVDGAGAGVQLQKWDGATWTSVGSNIGTADDRIDWFSVSVRIGGEDRLYFTNGVSELRYTNGTTVTVVTGIYAKYITAVGDVLVIAHPTDVFDQNYAIFAKANTHQFYSDIDGSYAASTQTFRTKGEITQAKSFNSLVYLFTKADGLFEVDLVDLTIRQISTHGTISPKSVDIGWDVMIWADQLGVWALPMGGDVLKISKKVDNIYAQLDALNIFQIVGHINTNGQYELYLGDITYLGVSYDSYCLVYEIDRSRQEGQNIWVEDYERAFPNNFVNWTNSFGFTQSYFGSRDSQSTYINDYEYDDDGDDINLIMETKDIPLVDEKKEAFINSVYIEYEPSGSSEIPMVVEVRTDTEPDWVEIQAPQGLAIGSSFISKARFEGRENPKGRTCAVRLSSLDSQSLSVHRILIYYTYNESDLPIENNDIP